MSVLLRVAYDGTDFHGFASQKPHPQRGPIRTVQGELEAALRIIYKAEVGCRGASRTDAGVHALGQLVAVDPPFSIPPVGLARGINGRTGDDLTVLAAWEQPGYIDVRRGNEGKHYRYRIACTEVGDPSASRYQWTLGRSLEPQRMREAAQRFVGTHDFASFRAAQCQAQTSERTVYAVDVVQGRATIGPPGDPGRLDQPNDAPDWIEVHVRGRAFLMNMVRIMVGTLVEIGLGRRPPDDVASLLTDPDRKRAGMTAPARGLTLVEVVRLPPPVESSG